MDKFNIRPLDFVKAKPFQESQCHLICSDSKVLLNMAEKSITSAQVGLVTEISNDGRLSIAWIGPNSDLLKNAWWEQEELEKLDSLPHLLAREMTNPFGDNRKEVDKYFVNK
mgnify:CR=1 FL=1